MATSLTERNGIQNGQKEGWSSDRNLLLENNHRFEKDKYLLICVVR